MTNLILLFTLFIFFIFFIVYKKDMIIKIFNLNTKNSAQDFKKELERTGDTVIQRLEEKITELEYLVAEADNRIEKLNERLMLYEDMVHTKETAPNAGNTPEYKMEADFSKQLALAAYKTEQRHTKNDKHDMKKEVKDRPKDKQQLALEMINQGMTEVEIAKSLGLGMGEVRLLIQLNKNK